MDKKQFDFLFKKGEKMMGKNKDPMHGWSHIARVLDYAWQIKNLLPKEKKEKIDDNILKILCVWHDISYVYYSVGFIQYLMEAKRSVKIIKREFILADVPQNEIDIIARIVSRHGFSTLGFSRQKF